MGNFLKNLLICTSLWAACCATEQPQQKKSAWQVINKELGDRRDLLPYQLVINPYKKELEAANAVYKNAGIANPPRLITNYEELNEQERAALRSGRSGAIAGTDRIWPSQNLLKALTSNDQFLRSWGAKMLLHEREHLASGHEGRKQTVLSLGLPKNMQDAYFYNLARRNEFEADSAALRGMSDRDLENFKNGLARYPAHGSSFHPSATETRMMVDEELQARKTGNRLRESESPAAKSFFARNMKVTAD